MKNMILGLALSLAASTSMARELTCRGEVDQNEYIAGGILSIELKAENLLADWMKEPVATVVVENYRGVETVVGRRNELVKDKDYKPRKYLNHNRYSLRKLIDIAKFSDFEPGDLCFVDVMIPNGAHHLNSFQAPVTISCDQSGGKAVLNCELK